MPKRARDEAEAESSAKRRRRAARSAPAARDLGALSHSMMPTTTGTSTDHGRAEAERVGGANPATSATQTVIKVSARLLAVAKPERSGEEAATEAVRKKAHHRVTLGIPGTPQTYVVTTNAQMPDS
ncbi:hypothetical protein PC116_g20082 [Phytophthora cactorum]|uniref:Uncharacterized protein n=1 Tax=Phytophthora cactorum TaxID=29920 RepID=A0A329SJX4_9STRA|nr:hypothetical protein PC113_g15825 [Phytophthora cactorum]KAG2996049.1 hypothetical protein PC119_g17941 [Phytophthora cactorum]KAG4231652.1 hypothetical protein PC116_g20082 [Phytophthora cactorum]RAW37093.1 hypothetical protein PC110_g6652 [Phytophthora cactorum]